MLIPAFVFAQESKIININPGWHTAGIINIDPSDGNAIVDTLFFAYDSIYITASGDTLILFSDTTFVSGVLRVDGNIILEPLATSSTTVLTPTSTGLVDTLETAVLATADIFVTGDWAMDTVTIVNLKWVMPHGMVSFHDSSETLTMSTGVWTHITNATNTLFAETDLTNITFAGDTMTINAEMYGDYMMNIGLSLSGTASDAYEITLFKNNAQTGPIMERTTSQTDVGWMGLPIYVPDLVAGDDLKLMIRNTASDDDATVIACSWTVYLLHK